MPVEKAGFRENLEILNRRFPDHDLLYREEVCSVCGWTSPTSVTKNFPGKMVNGRLSKVALAEFMCGGKKKRGRAKK